jgi:hypothetical protein
MKIEWHVHSTVGIVLRNVLVNGKETEGRRREGEDSNLAAIEERKKRRDVVDSTSHHFPLTFTFHLLSCHARILLHLLAK